MWPVRWAWHEIIEAASRLACIGAGARGTFVADCRITSSVRAPWLTEWMKASQATKAAVAG